jgi:uncharacterized protein involved in exopolysaccharide biosynthesis
LETKLAPIEQEIAMAEGVLGRYEQDNTDLRQATERHAVDKEAYQKLFDKLEVLQAQFNTTRTDYIAIQERATPASENVEDWVLPIAVGAIGGGLLGAALGFLLSLLIVRPAPPPLPSPV